MSDMVYRCVAGSDVDADGVCVEHGETACVIGVRAPSVPDDEQHRAPDVERERYSSLTSHDEH